MRAAELPEPAELGACFCGEAEAELPWLASRLPIRAVAPEPPRPRDAMAECEGRRAYGLGLMEARELIDYPADTSHVA